MSTLADVIRWAARVLSVLAVLFVLVFVAGEGLLVRGLRADEGIYLTIFFVALLANLASWRWERVGASVALLGLLGLMLVEGGVPGGWFFVLIGIPAVCSLLASALDRRQSTHAHA